MDHMVSSGIQVQHRIKQGNRPADAEVAILRANFIHCPVDIRPALCLLYFREQRHLVHFIYGR